MSFDRDISNLLYRFIPTFNAFSATSFPTAIATSTLVPFLFLFSLEEQE
jgi:hypothetical protein